MAFEDDDVAMIGANAFRGRGEKKIDDVRSHGVADGRMFT